MIEIMKKIITNVLTALYQPFGFSVIMAVLFLFFYMYARDVGVRKLIARWIKEWRENNRFRRIFLLSFYVSLILFRTLLNRDMWKNPVSDVIGIWGLYDEKGELTTEVIENLLLFVPFTILLFWSFQEWFLGKTLHFFKTLWRSAGVTFLFSLGIELSQLLFRLGTFQLSDLFYNTLGGLLGGMIYWSGYRFRNGSGSSSE